MNSMRDRLIKLLCGVKCEGGEEIGNCPQRRDGQCRTVQKLEMCQIGAITDHLLANGVIVTPCVAMVEQFIKDGEFDKKRTAHNGKYAVVYVDKSKWNCPLIDITEQSYNMEKAEERIQALKGERHAEIH